MIIVLNGPFGVGKTTAAQLLVERLPHSMLYDPEIVGAYLRWLARPFKRVDDFQEYRLWPGLVVLTAWLLQRTSRRSLIVPMTINNPQRYTTITRGFRRSDPKLVCIRLVAAPDVLRERIHSSDDTRALGWRLAHVDQGVASFQDAQFGIEINTNERSPEQVVDTILNLLPPPRTPH